MYQRIEYGLSQGAGGAAVALRPGIARGSSALVFDRFGGRFADVDLVPDLGARIGSAEWWRGLATCTALCASALLLSPGFDRAIPFAVPPAYTPTELKDAEALSIAPLALGADTGRRMAATDLVVPLTETPERPSIDLTAALGPGDSFARVLERSGVADAEAAQVAEMIHQIVEPGEVKAGTRLDITLGRRPNRNVPRPLDSLAFRAKFDLKIEVKRVNGALTLTPIPIAVDDTPLRIQGLVGDSLYRAARAAGAPAKAVEAYIRALSSKMSMGSIPSGAKFDLIVEHRRAETGEVEVGQLLFAGLDAGKRKAQLLRWEEDGQAQWFEANGIGQRRGQMVQPVSGRVSSSFGTRRHPILGYSRFHKGMDFAAPHGAPIRAATDGVVVFAGRNGGYGNYVRVKHAGGYMTSYAHMSRIKAQRGAKVRQGQVIGYVGSTGLSTGPHLHYELYKNGKAINPRSVKFTTQATLSGSELANFKAKLNRLLSIKPGAKAEPAQATATDKAP